MLTSKIIVIFINYIKEYVDVSHKVHFFPAFFPIKVTTSTVSLCPHTSLFNHAVQKHLFIAGPRGSMTSSESAEFSISHFTMAKSFQ